MLVHPPSVLDALTIVPSWLTFLSCSSLCCALRRLCAGGATAPMAGAGAAAGVDIRTKDGRPMGGNAAALEKTKIAIKSKPAVRSLGVLGLRGARERVALLRPARRSAGGATHRSVGRKRSRSAQGQPR